MKQLAFYNSYRVEENGCWLWIKCVGSHGYGMATYGGRRVTSSMWSWLLHRGKIPAGKLVLHTCDNKLCVNPDHLELGGYSKNLTDAYARGLR